MSDVSLDLVLVPGFLCDERLFAHQVSGLAARPGAGEVRVADITAETTIEAMAESVLAQAPERFAVAGLSLGGIVAAQVAHVAPQRVAGVALLDTNLAEPDRRQLDQRAAWADRVRAGDLFRLVVDDLVEPLTNDVLSHAPLIIDMALRAGADTFVRQNEALLHRRDRRDDLASFSEPVLIACGREDVLCPPRLHADLSERLGCPDPVVVADAGHLSTIDQPEALTSALWAWMNRCDNRNQLTPTGGESNEYTTT